MTISVNPYVLVRRIVVALLTGSLPDEYRDESLAVLTDAMSAPDEEIRALAVVGINEMGGAAAKAMPVLANAVHDSCEHVRRRAVRSLGEFGPTAAKSIPHLIAAVRDCDSKVRLEAVSALGKIGSGAVPAVPELIPLLGHEDTRTRVVTTATIKKIGTGSIPVLLDSLQEPDAIVRERVAYLLGQMRTQRDDVVEALLQATNDFDFDVRRSARGALELLSA